MTRGLCAGPEQRLCRPSGHMPAHAPPTGGRQVCQHPPTASTPRAGEDIQRERPAQQSRPIQSRRALHRRLHRRSLGRALLLQPRLRPRLREQKWPHFRAWSEDAVEPCEVCPRRRHQRRQTTEELQPGEEEARGAVGQRMLHPVREAAILHTRQSLQRQRATRPIAAQPLQPLPVVGMDVRIGMQGEAFQEGAPGLLSGRGPHVHPRPAQPLLQGVRLVRLPRVLRPLRGQGPSFLQQAQHPVTYHPQQPLHLCLRGRRQLRKGQRPLPVGHMRQHPLHQVHCRHMRPLRVTGGAHPSPLAREGDEQFVLATLAAHPREAVCQHSAFQVPGEVPLHVPGQAASQLTCLRQQRGEVVPHRLVQHRPLRLPPPVRPPALLHLPLPSHTSPGLTLRRGSHGLPWSPWLLGWFEARPGQRVRRGEPWTASPALVRDQVAAASSPSRLAHRGVQ